MDPNDENDKPHNNTASTNSSSSSSSSSSKDEQPGKLAHEATAYRILAVYKFVKAKRAEEDLAKIKRDLENHCRAFACRGSLLLAPEGINGTISYPNPTAASDNSGVKDPVMDYLKMVYPGIRTRLSFSDGHVFYRFKIKVKKEILTCRTEDLTNSSPARASNGDRTDSTASPAAIISQEQEESASIPDNTTKSNCPQQQSASFSSALCLDPTQQVGTYIPAGPAWDALLNDPECLVIDARNFYEIRLGSFRFAKNPNTQVFSDLIPWMQHQIEQEQPKKVAMFCTGGIRCEKASAACLDLVHQQHGTPKIPVYHLEGGILAYLDTVPEEQSLFDGSCYVFDQRVAVTHGLKATPHMTMCHACRTPLTLEEQEGHPDFIAGKQCTYCKSATSQKQQERFGARQRQIQLAQQKGLLHMHDPKEMVLTVLGSGSKQQKQQQLLQQQN